MQLKKVMAEAKAEGYDMSFGPEAEFFLFKRGDESRATLDPHDVAGYFDVDPTTSPRTRGATSRTSS